MKTLFYNPAQIITVNTNGKNYKRGNELNDISVLENFSIVVENEKISEIIPTKKISEFKFDEKIDLTNKIILPGLVEAHTHLVFAGLRADEFGMRLSGKSYEEIANSGGGINSTVKAVRESSFEELLNIAKPKVQNFIEQGVTTLEIKSGYGLSFYDEIKILQVIKELNSISPIDIKATFLGAHTFPPEYKNDQNQYIKILTKEIIPFISKNNLANSCDAFCEKTAFSPTQVEEIFSAAKENNLDVKLHTDQFNSIGGIEIGLKFNAQSLDHLEVIDEFGIEKISQSNSVAVLLPGVSFSLNYQFASARKLIEKNAIVSLATDFNPGSSHINNISLIWGLAALKMKMKIEEIISAYTINSAKALSLSDKIGSIEIGKSADFAVFETSNYNDLIYFLGQNLCSMVIKNGKVIYEKKS
ncbi:MAG: imidazolonepropionase [Ignavibacteriae bacterium]|nr:imidazolonepropionase [Ignavibacteriota bacterium]